MLTEIKKHHGAALHWVSVRKLSNNITGETICVMHHGSLKEKKTRLQTQTDLKQLSQFLPFVRQRSA